MPGSAGHLYMHSTHGSVSPTPQEIANMTDFTQGWRPDECGYIWDLKRIRILGRGSFGLATLVQVVSPLPDWFPSHLDPNQAQDQHLGPFLSVPQAADGATAPPSLNGSSNYVDVVAPCGDHDAPLKSRPVLLVVKEINLACCKQSERDALFREIHILRAVHHPNVVRYIDSCLNAETNHVMILMEYCDGGDLAGLIEAANRRTPTKGLIEPEIWALLIQLLMALKCLHLQHRIIHRDLKPQNIFLTSSGIVKVGDFGVSAVLSQSVDFARTFCGSPYYLAPELCEEQPYNGKADLWSLGCVLYEMLAYGQRAFQAKALAPLLLDIINARFTPINDVCVCLGVGERQAPNAERAGYTLELRRIVGLLLQRKPEDRASISRLLRLPSIITRARLLLQPWILRTDVYMDQFGGGVRPLPDGDQFNGTATWATALMSANASPNYIPKKRETTMVMTNEGSPLRINVVEAPLTTHSSVNTLDSGAAGSPRPPPPPPKASFTTVATGPVSGRRTLPPTAPPNIDVLDINAKIGSAVLRHGTVSFPVDSPMIPTVASEQVSPEFGREPVSPELSPPAALLPDPGDPPALTALLSIRIKRHADPHDGVQAADDADGGYNECDYDDDEFEELQDAVEVEERVYRTWRREDPHAERHYSLMPTPPPPPPPTTAEEAS